MFWCVSNIPLCIEAAFCQDISLWPPHVSNRSTSARDAASAYLPSDVEYKIFARNSNFAAKPKKNGECD